MLPGARMRFLFKRRGRWSGGVKMVLEVSVHPWRRDGGGMVREYIRGCWGELPRDCVISSTTTPSTID